MTDLCKEINKLGKGVGNAARYRILESLRESSKMAGELTRATKLSQPATSQHLKILKACNFVSERKDGKAVIYYLNTGHMLSLLNKLGTSLKGRSRK